MKTKVPVSARALLQRINRKLDGEVVKKLRGQSTNLGEYYMVDLQGNFIADKDVDLEGLGRKLQVLRPFEKLEA